MLLKQPATCEVSAVISIFGQREYPVEADVQHLLHLRFDDIASLDETDPFSTYRVRQQQRKAREIGLTLTPPRSTDAEAIINFARNIADLRGSLLCQCQGGVSRSSAAALLCLATWTGEGEESACVDYLMQIRPSAVPHADLVKLGDVLLNRHGRLFDAAVRYQRHV